MGRKSKENASGLPVKATKAKLTEPHRWLLSQLGNGNMTAGMELTATMTRLLSEAHLLLDGTEKGQPIADEISQLKIPEIYGKAKNHPLITRDENGEIESWIF